MRASKGPIMALALRYFDRAMLFSTVKMYVHYILHYIYYITYKYCCTHVITTKCSANYKRILCIYLIDRNRRKKQSCLLFCVLNFYLYNS